MLDSHSKVGGSRTSVLPKVDHRGEGEEIEVDGSGFRVLWSGTFDFPLHLPLGPYFSD